MPVNYLGLLESKGNQQAYLVCRGPSSGRTCVFRNAATENVENYSHAKLTRILFHAQGFDEAYGCWECAQAKAAVDVSQITVANNLSSGNTVSYPNPRMLTYTI